MINDTTKNKKCLYCGEEFRFEKGRKTKFCNRLCYKKWRREKDPNLRPKLKCLYCNNEYQKSRWYLKQDQGKFCSQKCYGKYLSVLWRLNPAQSPNWQGGLMTDRLKFYTSKAWRDKRKEIIKRDGQCVLCKSLKNYEVNHILPYSIFPELRLENDNLVTLCRQCHQKWTKIFKPSIFIRYEI